MDILQIELTIVIGSRLEQSLIDRFICVLQLDIFSYESYAYRIFGILHVCQEFPPGFQLRSRSYFHPCFSQNDFIEFLLLHFQRHLINRRYIDGLNDGIGFDITEQRYFTTQIDTQLMLGTQHENIRLNTDFLQLLYRVLGRLSIKGRDSISPTVPPISVMTKSKLFFDPSNFTLRFISSVICGII